MAKKTPPATNAVVTERTVELTGSTIRALLEPLPDQRVRILEYHRRRKGETRFVRLKQEEGVTLRFDQLKLDQTFEELFPQGTLFDAAD